MAVKKGDATETPDRADVIAAARKRMDMMNAPPWMPQPGDELIGHVDMLMVGTTEKYGNYPIVVYTVESMVAASGEAVDVLPEYIKVHAFHTLMRERLAELKTQRGSYQLLKYYGEKLSGSRKDSDGNDQPYHHYDVQDLNALATEPEPVNFAW